MENKIGKRTRSPSWYRSDKEDDAGGRTTALRSSVHFLSESRYISVAGIFRELAASFFARRAGHKTQDPTEPSQKFREPKPFRWFNPL